jgi:hypothetical protein
LNCGCRMLWTFDCHGHEHPASGIAFEWHDFVIEREWKMIELMVCLDENELHRDEGERDRDDRWRWSFRSMKRTSLARLRQRERKRLVTNLSWAHNLSSKLVEMDQSSLPIEVEEGLGRQSAVAEAILWAEQETEIVMFAISCLLLANYESLQL